MDRQQITQQIAQLEAQRDQALIQLGGINGALAVYRELLAVTEAQPPAQNAQEVIRHDEQR